MKTEHTPLPYFEGGNGFVYALNSAGINRFYLRIEAGRDNVGSHRMWITDEEVNANAEFIVRACNSHYEMLEALQTAVKCGMVPVTSASDGGASKYSEQVKVSDQIRSAIQKATGGIDE